jgi:Leucine-rich repeat (LRR) protein
LFAKNNSDSESSSDKCSDWISVISLVDKSMLFKSPNLNLEQNNIRKIEAETYKGVPRLKSLKLGNNNIRKIHPQAMTELSYLEILTLNNNKIRKLNNGVFSNLKKLYSIDLSRNKIRLIKRRHRYFL